MFGVIREAHRERVDPGFVQADQQRCDVVGIADNRIGAVAAAGALTQRALHVFGQFVELPASASAVDQGFNRFVVGHLQRVIVVIFLGLAAGRAAHDAAVGEHADIAPIPGPRGI